MFDLIKNTLFATAPEKKTTEPEKIISPCMRSEEKLGEGHGTPLNLTEAVYNITVLPKCHLYKQSTKMTFHNTHSKTLEGELIFPLPDKSTICGYALDVSGVMVDAVVVESQKAKKVFEEEVRSGQSVSIVEYVVGNCFKTKVYPIHSKQSRIVEIHHMTPLSAESKNSMMIDVPLEVGKHQNLQKLSVNIRVCDSSIAPKIQVGDTEIPMKLNEKDSVYQAELGISDLKNCDVLHIVIGSEYATVVAVEDNKEHGAHYFNISEFIDSVATEKIEFKDAKIAIFWDTSLSRDERKNVEELSIIEKFLTRGTFSIDLYSFSNECDLVGNFNSFDKLAQAIKALKYDGATNLNTVRYALDAKSYDFSVLFSDGIDTIADPREGSFKLKKKTPIYCISSGLGTNASYLEAISQVTGGGFYSIRKSTNLDEVAGALGSPPFGFISYDFDPEAIADLTPSNPSLLVNGKQFNCSGVLLKDKADLTIHFGFGNKSVFSKKVTLDKSNATISSILGTLWASRVIAELSIFEANTEEILSLGRKYSVVSPMTSFIFLQDVDQYLKHNIVPPKTCTQLFKDYNDRIDGQVRATNNKIDIVRGWWHNWKNWYNTDYYGTWQRDKKTELDALNSQKRDLDIQLKVLIKELEDIDARHKKILDEEQSKNDEKTKARLEEMKKKNVDVTDRIAKAEKELKAVLDARAEREQKLKTMKKVRDTPVPVVNKDVLPSPKEKLKICHEDAEEKKMDKMDMRKKSKSKKECRSDRDESMSQSGMMCHDEMAPPPPRSEALCVEQECCDEDGKSKEAPKPPSAGENTSSIKLSGWTPDVPYLNTLKKFATNEIYSQYFGLRPQYKKSPAFYIDCADYFFKQGLKKEALTILSNTLELELESAQLIRVVAYKLEELGALALSEQMFRRVLKMNPHEPQSYRDLALVVGKEEKYKESIQLLWKVVNGQWDSRFSEIELTALVELNRMIVFNDGKDIPSDLHKDFIFPTKLDLRINLAWDTDRTDIDMHTHEPTGEHVYYGAKNSKYGGLNSRDFTQGYGPETYAIKNALPGVYTIKARYFASHQQSLTGGTTALLSLYTHYGDREKEKFQQITIRLAQSQDDFKVGEIEIKNEKAQLVLDGIKDTATQVEVVRSDVNTKTSIKSGKDNELRDKRAKLVEADSLLQQAHNKQLNELEANATAAELKLKTESVLNEQEEKKFRYEYTSGDVSEPKNDENPSKKGGLFSSSSKGTSDFDVKL